jgi:hypothetical protein
MLSGYDSHMLEKDIHGGRKRTFVDESDEVLCDSSQGTIETGQ